MASSPPPIPLQDLPKTAEEAQEAILNLSTSAERRLIALGSHYAALNLDEETLKEVEDDLRRARLYEVYVLSSIQRRCELDAQRRRLAEMEIGSLQKEREMATNIQRLRKQALVALQREAEHERESTLLMSDRRAILEREKNQLLERRRAFDRGELTPRDASGSAALGYKPKEGAPPVVVMNVAIGNGRQEQLVVRDGDDPRRIAVAFVRKYQLPEHTVQTLQQQIVQNIQNYERKRAATPGRGQMGAGSAAARAMSTATVMGGGGGGSQMRAVSPAASTRMASTPRSNANPLMRV